MWRESGSEEMAGTTDEQEALLREATAIKMTLLQSTLDSDGDEKQAATEEAAVKLLAQLQVYQDQEAELLLANISNKVEHTPKHLDTLSLILSIHHHHLRNKTCFPCLHSLVKTEANVWENSRADQ